jgi:hypothetical protein
VSFGEGVGKLFSEHARPWVPDKIGMVPGCIVDFNSAFDQISPAQGPIRNDPRRLLSGTEYSDATRVLGWSVIRSGPVSGVIHRLNRREGTNAASLRAEAISKQLGPIACQPPKASCLLTDVSYAFTRPEQLHVLPMEGNSV